MGRNENTPPEWDELLWQAGTYRGKCECRNAGRTLQESLSCWGGLATWWGAATPPCAHLPAAQFHFILGVPQRRDSGIFLMTSHCSSSWVLSSLCLWWKLKPAEIESLFVSRASALARNSRTSPARSVGNKFSPLVSAYLSKTWLFSSKGVPLCLICLLPSILLTSPRPRVFLASHFTWTRWEAAASPSSSTMKPGDVSQSQHSPELFQSFSFQSCIDFSLSPGHFLKIHLILEAPVVGAAG